MNNTENSAGASRRSRRLALNSLLTLLVGLALLIVIDRGIAMRDEQSSELSESFARTDAEIAEHLLQSVAGANAVLCAAVDRSFNFGHWGGETLGLQIEPSNAPEVNETARWIGKRRLDRTVLPVAKRHLTSADACVRRIAARIAGSVDVRRLDEELKDELESASMDTRVAAIIAIGHAEQKEAFDLLQRSIRDGDKRVRYASLWAMGALEDERSVPVLIPLLQNDPDPEIRRIAAWALGNLD